MNTKSLTTEVLGFVLFRLETIDPPLVFWFLIEVKNYIIVKFCKMIKYKIVNKGQ
jgi:hypothetical protein